MESQPKDVTVLLQAWGRGDKEALDRLMPLVYDELHRVAQGYMVRERPNHTLQATALVNEAYVRMVDSNGVDWKDRAHFFAVCARMMRRILVDRARARGFQKRGAGQPAISLEESLVVGAERPEDLVALDDALTRLAAVDPRKSRVVELRFFSGLGVEETAAVLNVSPETVMRDWKMAKAWLHRELST
jgi:RNA polymerase sigma factor (TIGR02999 family)